MKKIFDTLVKKTEDYIIRNGLKSMVLGISGGIDSTVCAAICHRIVKRNANIKFYGISLPSLTNCEDERNSALLVGKAFFIEQGNTLFWEENIQESFENLKNLCSKRFDNTPLSLGNIKARIRNIYLRDIAGKTKGIVISTGNKSEDLTGFFTIAGDVGDLGIIENLWKHEVFELAKWVMDQEDTTPAQKEAIEYSLKLTPTDGNGVTKGGDLEQIAPELKSYEELDEILDSIASERDLDNLVKKYGLNSINQVKLRYEKTKFKREPQPIKIEL